MPTDTPLQNATVNPMRAVFRRLSEAGFPEKFVREVALPDWWDDAAAGTASGLTHGLMLISRHLGVDLASLQEEAGHVRLILSAPCKFKKRADATADDLVAARAIAFRVGELAVAALEPSACPLPTTAAEIRRLILGEGHRWVSFQALVAFCWSAGVPVLHLSRFPRGARRPDGLAALVHGRPVILLCRQQKSPAWMLFILAHELGHLVKGHVSPDGLLIDDRLAEDDSDSDEEEAEANAFAIELLSGRSRVGYFARGRWPNARTLAAEAQSIARRDRIDPGHIVLNYAHAMGRDFFPVANAALKIIEKDQDAVALLREGMAAQLDWSALPQDSSTFLMRLTQAKEPADEEEPDHSSLTSEMNP